MNCSGCDLSVVVIVIIYSYLCTSESDSVTRVCKGKDEVLGLWSCLLQDEQPRQDDMMSLFDLIT